MALAHLSALRVPRGAPLGLSHTGLGSFLPLPTGFQLSGHLLQLIVLRYADQELQLGFDDFLNCLVRLENARCKCPHPGGRFHLPSITFQVPTTSNLQKTMAETGPRRRGLRRLPATSTGRWEASRAHLGRASLGHVPQPGESGAAPFSPLPPALCVL